MIAVQYIRFSKATMDAPGLTSSSVTTAKHPENGRGRKHLIDYCEERQGYHIRFYDREALNPEAKMLYDGWIWRSPGDYVEFVKDMAAKARPKPPAAKRKK